MRKLILVATAALTASSVVHAAANSEKPQQKRAASSKRLVTSSSLRQRTVVANASVPSSGPTGAVSERPSSQKTSHDQAIQSRQSSATRMALPGATSTVEATKPGPRMIPLDNFKFSTNVYYYGSSVASPFDSRVPDFYHGYEENDDGDRTSADVHFSAGYRVHPNYTVSINPQFSISPSNSTSINPKADRENHFMKPIASYLKVGVGQIFAYKNFKWNGDLRYYPGITNDLNKNFLAIIRTGQNFTWTLTKATNFALYTTWRYHARNHENYEGNPATTDFRTTWSPTIEHQVNDKVGVAISYNLDNRKPGNVSPLDFGGFQHEANGPYIEAGTSLDLISNLNINPYVDLYTRRPNFYGTRWGMNLSWTIL